MISQKTASKTVLKIAAMLFIGSIFLVAPFFNFFLAPGIVTNVLLVAYFLMMIPPSLFVINMIREVKDIPVVGQFEN